VLSVTIYVRDLAAMESFYAEVTGATCRDRGDSFATLATSDFSFTLAQIPAEYAATFSISNPPEPREEAAIKVSFPVTNLERARAIVDQYGGISEVGMEPWEWNGVVRVNVVDPEGNVVEITSPR
jgi:predicted enzyme related to lactoylglutathione lyase